MFRLIDLGTAPTFAKLSVWAIHVPGDVVLTVRSAACSGEVGFEVAGDEKVAAVSYRL